MKEQTITSPSTYITYSSTYLQPCLPEAYIAVKGNRVKSYFHNNETCVYLENGTEFQIELYNNSNFKVKAVFEINGNIQNNALVLKPYQRFYLDRFMDEQKKLKCETFMTGNDDIEKLKEIIAKNGRIKIYFYKEFIPLPQVTWSNIWYDSNVYDNDTASPYIKYGGIYCNSGDNKKSSVKSSVKSFRGYTGQITNKDKEIETASIEAGENSNQEFIPTYEQFEWFTTAVFEYHIMPLSQKPKIPYNAKYTSLKKKKDVIVADDIRTYCPGCGRRVKKGWQYCAGCGRKF